MNVTLLSALNWYQKKIGTYDKQLWEKTVDERISEGLCAIPKKKARIKTELIDVDLVRGSAFPKAKPQHSWIAATLTGVVRILFLPFYFMWWTLQTHTLVSCTLEFLYISQLLSMYLFYSSDESNFEDIPASEALMPLAMMLVLGILHSQIVATFSTKSSHKQVSQTKRKKTRHKQDAKSSATASGCRPKFYKLHFCSSCRKEKCNYNSRDFHTTTDLIEFPVEDINEMDDDDSDTASHQDNKRLKAPNEVELNSEGDTSGEEEYYFTRKHLLSVNERIFRLKHGSGTGKFPVSCVRSSGSQLSTDSVTVDGCVTKSSNDLPSSCDSCVNRKRKNVMVLQKLKHVPATKSIISHETKFEHISESLHLATQDEACYSSGDSGPESASLNGQLPASDGEWPLTNNSDCLSDSSDITAQSSHEDESDASSYENPFAWEIQEVPASSLNAGCTSSDKVSCTIWQKNECKKVDLSVLDISSAIIRKVDASVYSTEYLAVGLLFSMIIGFLPLLFRLQSGTSIDTIQDVTFDMINFTVPSSDYVVQIWQDMLTVMIGSEWRVRSVVLIAMVERFTLSLAYFFLLSVAEKTFKQRFLYAKHFSYLTSSRRARRTDLPHFRLNKVRNIKTWLSVRSYLKKLGPQRSVDVTVSMTFILEVCVLSFLCVQLLKETGQFAAKLQSWETLFWTLALGFYLLRFMIIGSKINKKYRNLSVLITEQINLYLHMEQKPHKKDELMLANSVLKLAADLLKELESPFKISGLCANPYLYNITKVVVLSAFSAVLTEVLGFKLKLYKIKLQ